MEKTSLEQSRALFGYLIKLPRQFSLISLIVLFLGLLPIQNSIADSDPTISISAPASSSLITPDAPFSLTFKIEGGWAAKYSDCRFNGSSKFLQIAIARVDNNGYSELFQSTYPTWNPNSASFDSKITPNGIECTFVVKPQKNGNWYPDWQFLDSGQRAEKLLDLHLTSKNKLTKISKIVVGYQFASSIDNSDPTRTGRATFLAGNLASPVFQIEGVVRGENISYSKSYKVRLSLGEALTPSSIYSATVVGRNECSPLEKVSSNQGRDEYLSNCLYQAVGYLGPAEIRPSITTTDDQSFYADPIAVNIIKIGALSLDVQGYIKYGPNSKPGNLTTSSIRINGDLTLFAAGLGGSKNLPNSMLKVCLNTSCSDVMTDSNGYFVVEKEVKGNIFTYTVEGKYDGVAVKETGNLDIPQMAKPGPVAPTYKPGMPKGKVDKSSEKYKFGFQIGKNFRNVSLASDTAAKQCGSAQATGMIKNNGIPYYLGQSASKVISYLRTASGYKGCLDGFGR